MAQRNDIILVVEDNAVSQLLYNRVITKAFPKHKILVVSDLSTAAEVLTDSTINVVAAIIDNGFPLVPGGARKGKARIPEGHVPEKEQLDKEGGAGTMLMRFIRTGKSGALAKSTLDQIWNLELLGDPSTRYKHLPIVWNSASPEAGKVAAVEAAVEGKAIDLSMPHFLDTNVRITPGAVMAIDDHTAATDKQSVHAIVGYLQQQLAHQLSVGSRDNAGRDGPT